MKVRMSQAKAESKFLPRYRLLEAWAGHGRNYRCFDLVLGYEVLVSPNVAFKGGRKGPAKSPKRRHGCTNEPWFKSYEAMIRRGAGKHPSKCYTGVFVCAEWVDDPREFGKWAASSGYQPGLTIDRINPKDGYHPSNCQWISLSENVRRSHASSPRTKRNKRGEFHNG